MKGRLIMQSIRLNYTQSHRRTFLSYYISFFLSGTSTMRIITPKIDIGSVLWEKVFFEILQNSQLNTCARASFLIKLQDEGL